MPHATPLIGIIVAGLVLAFVLGAIAFRLKLPPLVGYLLAGVAVGPFTPGYVADQNLANELAELGVILLMFGVGLHFSIRDLLSVRRVAVPGAVVQIAAAIGMGGLLGWVMDWPLSSSLMFGLALSVASTVVLLRALQERRLIDTDRGRVAVGWLIVEDLVMVLALVLIPALSSSGGEAGAGALGWILFITLAKVAGFIAFMLIVGRRAVPWMLHEIAHGGSRELFRLAVLATALGVAFGAAMLFGVSFALGAFFAGVILAESPFSQRAAQETLPLRDAFAVLFFVSVGMLFNPSIVLSQAPALAATVFIIVIGKSLAAFAIVRLFGRSTRTALTISASLAQIGEFSFILATLGTSLGLLLPVGRDLILAGAIISIMLNPLLFALISRFVRDDAAPAAASHAQPGHVILVGCGRVGGLVHAGLAGKGRELVVIEAERDIAAPPDPAVARLITGNAASPDILEEAGVNDAGVLLVAIPDTFEAGQIIEQARAHNPELRIVARASSDAEVAYLQGRGANQTIMGEREIARRMIEEVSPAK